MYPALSRMITKLEGERDLIPAHRESLLEKMARYVAGKVVEHEPAKLNFICTHNSRRSQISQVWATTAASFYGLESITAYSGGTEATAFNKRAVDALERAGFQIHDPGGQNPHYEVSFSSDLPPFECFSKVYDSAPNPTKSFAAIMTCSDADENCPFIPGAELRLPLTYVDPKEADDTLEESMRYDERVQQIGREILYAMHLAKQQLLKQSSGQYE